MKRLIILSGAMLIFTLVQIFSACDGGDDDDAADSVMEPDDDASADNDSADDDIADDDASDDDSDDDVVDDDSADDDTHSDDDTTADDDIDDDAVDDDSSDDDVIDDDSTDDDADDDTSDDDVIDDDTGDDDAFPACESYAPAAVAGNIPSAVLSETSGLAVSLQNPGVIWAHNDSGAGPDIHVLTLEGAYLGTATLTGATAIDWEDMAVGPCGTGEDECLYLGDIGDNGASRTDAAVYRVPEPLVDPTLPFGEMSLDSWERLPFSYPDGPRDAESLAVHPDGRIFVIAKYPAGSSAIYVFPETVRGADEPVILDYVGDLNTGSTIGHVATGADIHRSGRRLILRTYLSIVEWRLAPGEPFENIADGERLVLPAGIEIQGESVAYDPYAGGYYHASEGAFDPPLFRVDCARR